jgi:hypothetical protein
MESKVYMYFFLKKSDEIITCYEKIPPSHSHITWAEVSSSAAHLLHNGIFVSPIK